MHTKFVGQLRIHYNSDWSGKAIVAIPGKRLVVSAEEFLALAKEVAADDTKDRIIAFIEDMKP